MTKWNALFFSPLYLLTSGTSVTQQNSCAQHTRVPKRSTHLYIWRWVDWNAYGRWNWRDGRDDACNCTAQGSTAEAAETAPQLQHPVPGPPQGEHRRHWLPPLAVEMKHHWSLVTAAEAVHISLATGSKQSQPPEDIRKQQWWGSGPLLQTHCLPETQTT